MIWSVLDHTGDLGIDVAAPTLPELFSEAMRGFTDCLTEVSRVRPLRRRRLEVTATELDLLLADWLQEVLFLFDTESLVFSEADVELDADGGAPFVARTRLAGELFDPHRHPLKTPIKAVTYHGLRVAADSGGWGARLVFDL